MIYVKIHDTDEGTIIAMCDESLIGRVLEEGDLVLDLKDYSDFYVGDLVDPESMEFPEHQKFNSANIVGKEAVETAIKQNLIKEENVNKVMDVPYAHAYWMNPE
ncbi:MAG: hypothetical protein BK997_02175 [Candidatus Micrarchaeum sp. ARMAN-1]|jgi:hypothetical protein|nr:MAG: hypothetical protein BK997_02175 [Candidatus Micrarchaeum sp. ARMAN-1]